MQHVIEILFSNLIGLTWEAHNITVVHYNRTRESVTTANPLEYLQHQVVMPK